MGARVGRFPDWEYRLGCFLERVKDRPRVLSYPHIKDSDWDCGKFVCQAILHMTGREVSVWVHCYSNWRTLAKLMGDAFEFDLYVKEKMGQADFKEIPVEESSKGDALVVKEDNGRRSLAIRIDNHAVAPGVRGLEFAPIENAIVAYKVE